MKIKVSEKLKLSRFTKIAIIDLPTYLLEGFDVTFVNRLEDKQDCIIAFVKSLDEFHGLVKEVLESKKLTNEGVLFVAYPHMKNNLGLEGIERDAFFPFLKLNEETGYIDNTPLMFNTMLSLDDNYTILGLKYDPNIRKNKIVIPKNNNDNNKNHYNNNQYQNNKNANDNKRQDNKKSPLEDLVKNDSKAYETYKTLSYKYIQNWQNYINGSNSEAQRQQRISEMKMILGLGFKSREFFMKHKKGNTKVNVK